MLARFWRPAHLLEEPRLQLRGARLGLATGLPLGGLFVVAVLTAIGCYYRRKPQTPNPTEPSQVAEVEISRA